MKIPQTPFLTSVLAILLSPSLSADTWFVDESAEGMEDGTSWEDAFTNLQDGLAAASADDDVLVAEGAYFPDVGGAAVDNDRHATFQLITGVQVRGGYPAGGGPRDLGQHRTVLSGDIDGDDTEGPVGGNSYSVVTGSGTDSTAILDGVTITGGLADAGNPDPFDGPTRAGGAFFSSGGSPTLRNCSVIRNMAGFGGGVFNIDSAAPTLVNCLIAGNKATFFGGGVNNRDSALPVLVNCTLTANSADSPGGGGAITNFSVPNPTLTNCIIWNNEANGDRTTEQASVNDGGGTETKYEYCLVENIVPLEMTSLDGTLAANNPSFLIPGDPSAAPALSGDFRLEAGSPALDAGDNAANSEMEDIIGNPRAADGMIDLGAYEGGFPSVLPDFLHVDKMVVTPGGGGEWANAFRTLNDALAVAVSGQTIRVATGTYFPDKGSGASEGDRDASFQLKSGITIVGGYPSGGGPRDLTANPTILSGDIDGNDSGAPVGGNSYTVVSGSNTGPSAVLDGFIITAGLANATEGDFDSPGRSGGAIHNNDGSPTLLNCVLRGNFANTGGAGMNIERSDPRFVNCVVSGNKTTGFGGGFHNRDSSSPIFINTTISGNSADSNGGGMSNFTSTPRLFNCIIWNNEANGSTETEGASIGEGGSFVGSYEFCLIQNRAAEGTNFDGTDPSNDPLLFLPLDPFTAPSSGGDFRLSGGSAAVDAGDASANPLTTDITGDDRVQGAGIDLGAFEGTVMVIDTDDDGLSDSFELTHTMGVSNTALAPDSNDDKDPFTALEEFAFGLNPNVANGIADAYSTAIVEDAMMNYLSITWAINPAAIPFVEITPEGSEDLGLINPWDDDETVPISAPAGMGAVRSDTPIGSQSGDFLRLKVEKRVGVGN